ncbi:prepilin peptidase [Streptomyces sp. NPDC057245]|uniref:prepilin peptidase n=1 Tax=Streptomyces sp. NPDC057245 TaxID=3346065 RepID=UPI003632F8E0
MSLGTGFVTSLGEGLGVDFDLLAVLVAALWGVAAGALLPRAVYRFSAPSGEAWRERCPGEHQVRGWLGPARCGQCADGENGENGENGESGGRGQGAYGPGAGLLAAVTAVVCVALAAATGARPEVTVWLLLAPVGVLLAAVDMRVRRLPDPLTLPLAGAALLLLGLVALVPEHAGEWTTALLGSLALGAGYLVLFLINPAGMGFGDVKLALTAGAVLGWYGWPTLMLGTFAGFLLGALYGGALLVTRRAGRKTAIPFGPFLIAGAFLGVLVGAFAA